MRAASTACTVSGIGNVASGSPSDPRALRLHERAAVDQLADELLEEERVAVRPLDDGPANLLRQVGRQHLVEHARGDVRREGAEPEHRRVPLGGAPRRTFDEQVRARGREHDERGADVRDDALEEVEEIGLGPVDVLHEEHRRALQCELLHESHRGQVQLLSGVERMDARGDVETERQPEELAPREAPFEVLGGCALAKSQVLANDLAERPVRDPVAVRETATGADGRSGFLACEGDEELAHQTRLPDARLADERHEVRLRGGRRAPVRRTQQLELAVPPHEHPP